MTAADVHLMTKAAVTQRLQISDRTLEKLVKARRFPPPLRLGKTAQWEGAVVEAWLVQALAPQRNWRPRRRDSGAGDREGA